MRRLNKVLTLLICVVLVMGLMPFAAFAAPAPTLKSITVAGAKPVYNLGDTLSITVTGKYSDGSTKVIPAANYVVRNFATTKLCSGKVATVVASGKTATFTYGVVNGLKSIAAVNTKSIYTVGDALDLATVTVTGTYADGTTKVLPVTAASFSNFSTIKPCSGRVVTVKYGGMRATFTMGVIVPKLTATALNSRQIQVVFVKAVNKVSAETAANYELNGVSPAGLIVKLQSDNKTAILTLTHATAILNNQASALVIKNVLTDTFEKVATSNNAIIGNDTTAPAVTSIEAKAGATTTKTVKIYFNEPVFTIGAYKVNGTIVSAALSNVTGNANDTSVVVLTLASGVATGTSLTVHGEGVYDSALNRLASFDQTITVSSDATGPKIVGITQANNTKIVAEFDKEISDKGDAVIRVYAAGVGYAIATEADATIDPQNAKKINIAIPTSVFSSWVSSTTLSVSISGLKDSSGNANTAVTSYAVTFTKDATAAKVTSVSLDSTNNTDVYVMFDKALSSAPASGAIRLYNAYGQLITTNVANASLVNASRGTTGDRVGLKIRFTTALAAGTYRITVDVASFKDVNLIDNALVDSTITTTAITDTLAPTVTATAALSNGKNVISLVFSKPMVAGTGSSSPINAANYILDGAVLPAGTVIYFTDDTKTRVAIELPASWASTGDKTLAIQNAQSESGVPIVYVEKTVSLVSTSRPALVSVKAIPSDKIEFTFNKPVRIAAAAADNVVTFYSKLGLPVLTLTGANLTVPVYNGNKVTVTVPAATFDAVTFDNLTAVLPTASVFVDAANAAVGNALMLSTAGVAFTDAYTKTTIGSFAMVQDTGANKFKANVTAGTISASAAFDKLSKIHVYLVAAGAPAFPTTVADIEATRTKSATVTVDSTGTAVTGDNKVITCTIDAAGNAIVNGTYAIYIISEDNAGNKLLQNAGASVGNYVVTGPVAPALPTIDYVNETITVPTTVEYATANTFAGLVIPGTGAAATIAPGTDLYFRTVATANVPAGASSAALVVAVRPATPLLAAVTVAQGTVATKTSVNVAATLEYRIVDANGVVKQTWTTGTGAAVDSTVAVVAGDKVQARVKAVAGASFASLNYEYVLLAGDIK